jgi:glutamyl-tRNA(Gln) amidotransferase subunit E
LLKEVWLERRLSMNLDYEAIGLTIGIETHQQLKTRYKLFCNCNPDLSKVKPEIRFLRRLRPTQSEMGQVDPAAFFEFQKGKTMIYEAAPDTSCLVEMDEEPPHHLNNEAVDICLTIALMLQARIVDEIHVMRKVVIDGSNTTGFQRTAIVAREGTLDVSGKSIPIQNICLEEDAARKIVEKGMVSHYAIDRLGIPLIEVTTGPVIYTPEEAQEVAKEIGDVMRATGNVKRGIGTIRQDLNISITGGGIIEVKGVQRLEDLQKVVRFEAHRQHMLMVIRDELKKREVTAKSIQGEIIDATKVLESSKCQVINDALRRGGVVLAVRIPSFGEIFGRELGPGIRFGTEVSDYARFWGGVGGIFHTDELPAYRITKTEKTKLMDFIGCTKKDVVVFVADERERCEDALKAVVTRCKQAIDGVPPETRASTTEGTTRYMRPRPGAERMYPETDVPPIAIKRERIERIRQDLPEMPREIIRKLRVVYGLNEKLADQLSDSKFLDLFETIMNETKLAPALVAVTLTETLKSLRRDGIPVDTLDETEISNLFLLVDMGKITKEAIPDILDWISNNKGRPAEEAVRELGLERLGDKQLKEIAKRILDMNTKIRQEPLGRARKILLGLLMKEVRGRAEAEEAIEVVNRLLSS